MRVLAGTPESWTTYRRQVEDAGVLVYEVEAFVRDGVTVARSRTLASDGTFEWTELERVGRRFLRREGLTL